MRAGLKQFDLLEDFDALDYKNIKKETDGDDEDEGWEYFDRPGEGIDYLAVARRLRGQVQSPEPSKRSQSCHYYV